MIDTIVNIGITIIAMMVLHLIIIGIVARHIYRIMQYMQKVMETSIVFQMLHNEILELLQKMRIELYDYGADKYKITPPENTKEHNG